MNMCVNCKGTGWVRVNSTMGCVRCQGCIGLHEMDVVGPAPAFVGQKPPKPPPTTAEKVQLRKERRREVEHLALVTATIFKDVELLSREFPQRNELLVERALNLAELIIEGAALRVLDRDQVRRLQLALGVIL